MSLISLLFEPRTISFPLMERELTQKFDASQARALYLMAPEGMGKTTAALNYYMRWTGPKLWLNVAFLHGHYQPLTLLHDELINRGLMPILASDNAQQEEMVEQLAAALTHSKQPLLLVFDGFAGRFNSLLLDELYRLIPMLPEHVRIVMTAHANVPKPPSSLLSSAKLQAFVVDDLCFNNAEVERMFEDEVLDQPELMALVRSCEGWPALLRLLQQLPLTNMALSQVEQALFEYLDETLPKMVSADARAAMSQLSHCTRFNRDLCQRLDGIEPGHIEHLRAAGLVKHMHIGAHCNGFRWRGVIARFIQTKVVDPQPDSALLQHYLQWADANAAWAESLSYAIHVETIEQLEHRVIRDGYAVQERGQATLLRRACDLILTRNPASGERRSFVWVDLVACWHSDMNVMRTKIRSVREKFSEQPVVLAPVDVLEAQLALSDSDYDKAEQLLAHLEEGAHPLPVYFQLQMASIRGELAIHMGQLDVALNQFRSGEELARKHAYPSSLLWHLHQQCQVLRLKGQASVADHKRFLAIQFAREQNFTSLAQYDYLLQAKCEQYLSEIRVNEARSVLLELERRLQHAGLGMTLPVASLKLELHRLSCILIPDYRCNIAPVVQRIEQQIIQGCHVYQRVRAEARLLSHWQQTQQWHCIAQWYKAAAVMSQAPANVEQLIHLRNLLYANQALSFFGLNLAAKWPESLPQHFAHWTETWPSAAYATIAVWALQQEEDNPALAVCWLLNAISGFGQMNELAEPLAFNPAWLEVIGRVDVKVRRIQASFISRLHALWGNRVKSRAVARDRTASADTRPIGLSPREQQVLEHIAEGMTNDRIAEMLNLSLGTVKNLLTQVYRKLGVSGRQAASHRFRSLAAK